MVGTPQNDIAIFMEDALNVQLDQHLTVFELTMLVQDPHFHMNIEMVHDISLFSGGGS